MFLTLKAMQVLKTRDYYLTNCLWLLVGLLCSGIASAKPKPVKEKQYHTNGQLEATGMLVNGVKHKRWEYYSAEGVKLKTEKWKMGALKWQIWYTPKGKVAKTVDSKGKEKIRPACGCS